MNATGKFMTHCSELKCSKLKLILYNQRSNKSSYIVQSVHAALPAPLTTHGHQNEIQATNVCLQRDLWVLHPLIELYYTAAPPHLTP